MSAAQRVEARQLLLDLPVREGRTLADFLPAPCNRAALEAILRWPDWPAPAVLLVGPEGSGKSHLAAAWVARVQAERLRGIDLAADDVALDRIGPARQVAIDDADMLCSERALLHLYNLLVERRGRLLLTARAPLAGWGLRLADLRSRLSTAWTVHIDPPDDALLAALLVKQFADRQLRVEPGVIEFLLARMERSFAGARRLVGALDRASLGARRPIGVALVRPVLAALAAPALEAGDPGEETGRWT